MGNIKMREDLKLRKFKHLLNLLKKSDDVLELGAHVGFLSGLIANEANSVIAIEPTPFIFDILQNDAKPNMTVCQYAVWGKNYESVKSFHNANGKRYIKRGKIDAAQFNTFADKRGIGDSNIDVVVKPFSEIVETYNHCNVLVMDIETTEYEILTQNVELIKSQFEMISFEYHCVASEQNSLQFLDIYKLYKDSFKYFYLIPNYTIKENKTPSFFQGTTVATLSNVELADEINGIYRIEEVINLYKGK